MISKTILVVASQRDSPELKLKRANLSDEVPVAVENKNEEDWVLELSSTRVGPRKYKYGANETAFQVIFPEDFSCYTTLCNVVDIEFACQAILWM